MKPYRSIITLSLGLFALISYQYIDAQTGNPPQPIPAAAPPGGNIDPPITTGSDPQVKRGDFGVELLSVYAGLDVTGDTNIDGQLLQRFEAKHNGQDSYMVFRPNVNGQDWNMYFNTDGQHNNETMFAEGYAFRKGFDTVDGVYTAWATKNSKKAGANVGDNNWEQVFSAGSKNFHVYNTLLVDDSINASLYCGVKGGNCVSVPEITELIKTAIPNCRAGETIRKESSKKGDWSCVPDSATRLAVPVFLGDFGETVLFDTNADYTDRNNAYFTYVYPASIPETASEIILHVHAFIEKGGLLNYWAKADNLPETQLVRMYMSSNNDGASSFEDAFIRLPYSPSRQIDLKFNTTALEGDRTQYVSFAGYVGADVPRSCIVEFTNFITWGIANNTKVERTVYGENTDEIAIGLWAMPTPQESYVVTECVEGYWVDEDEGPDSYNCTLYAEVTRYRDGADPDLQMTQILESGTWSAPGGDSWTAGTGYYTASQADAVTASAATAECGAEDCEYATLRLQPGTRTRIVNDRSGTVNDGITAVVAEVKSCSM